MGEPRKRGIRSPGYPVIDLRSALNRARQLKEYAPNRKPIPIDSALRHWGFGPKSGTGFQQLASVKKFDLILDQGSKDQRTVQLTDLAWKILTDPRDDSEPKQAALREAALAPAIHKKIHDRYPNGLPDDTNTTVWLVQEEKYNEKAVPLLLKQVRATFEFAQLDSAPATGNDTDHRGQPNGPSAIKPGDLVQWISKGIAQFQKAREVLRVEEHNGKQFLLVTDERGQERDIPMSQATLVDRDSQTDRTDPPHPVIQERRGQFPEGTEESRWKLSSGCAVVWLPSKMTQKDFKILRGQLKLLEMASADDDDDEQLDLNED